MFGSGLRTKLGVDMDVDASRVGSGIGQAESRFSKFGAVAKKAMLGVVAGVGLAIGAGVKLAQMAAEDQQAQVKLATILKNTTGARKSDIASVEDWITVQGKTLGVADDELRPALGRLAAATHDVGKAQSLASLAMDVSAGTGKSLEAVSTALAKAQTGNIGALGRLGVATKDAEGNTLSLGQVTKQLADTYQGAASASADTAAGRFQRLKLQLGELGEGIGGKLLPIANKLGQWALDMLPKAQRLGAYLGEKLGPVFTAVGGFISDKVVPAGRQLYEWFVNKIAPGIRRYVTPIIEGLRSVFNDVRNSVSDNREEFKKLGDFLATVVEFVATKVAPVFGQTLKGALVVVGKILGTTIKIVGKIIDLISTAIDKAKALKDALDGGGGHNQSDPPLPQFPGGPPSGGGAPPPMGSTLKYGTTAAAPTQPTVVINVNVDGSGIVDQHAVAATIVQALGRYTDRLGLSAPVLPTLV